MNVVENEEKGLAPWEKEKFLYVWPLAVPQV